MMLDMVSPPPMPSPSELASLVRAAIPRLYAFAYVMSGGREGAFVHVREAIRNLDLEALAAAPRPADWLLGKLARGVEEALGRKADHSFVILDNLLRSDETQPIDPGNSPEALARNRRIELTFSER